MGQEPKITMKDWLWAVGALPPVASPLSRPKAPPPALSGESADALYTYTPKPEDYLDIKDERSSVPVTQRQHATPLKDTVRNIIDESLAARVDPATALAMALQETRLGTAGGWFYNPLHNNSGAVVNTRIPVGESHPLWKAFIELQKGDERDAKTKKEIDAQIMAALRNTKEAYAGQGASIKEALEHWKSVQKGQTDPLLKIQAYNGLGKVVSGGTWRPRYGNQTYTNPQMYGRAGAEVIDMKKDPVYAKRVVDLRDNVIKKNAVIMSMIDEMVKVQKAGRK